MRSFELSQFSLNNRVTTSMEGAIFREYPPII